MYTWQLTTVLHMLRFFLLPHLPFFGETEMAFFFFLKTHFTGSINRANNPQSNFISIAVEVVSLWPDDTSNYFRNFY